MCRLFGLHAGHPVTATFWLLDAPDSLSAQSRRNPDGTGLGVFEADGTPVVRKQPIAAWRDLAFAAEAREMTGTTFIAHVRYATTGATAEANTHPFLQDNRIFAHNGIVEGLDILDARLTQLGAADLVRGDTDSERVFALITASIRGHGGDVGAGLVEALHWLRENVPIYAVNVLLATVTDLWALRYPDTHELYLLDRTAGGHGEFAMRSTRITAGSAHLHDAPSAIFATEPMDDGRWQLMESGELVHVAADLTITRRTVLPDPPVHQLTMSDLSPNMVQSQHPPA
ncbi:class II glutamine amidotransferase [Mycolicibacterium confluentis]|uniref:Class II glutamine amidotransferase n=1 Tax=Mycolicibacterium confluentis TaxID=28047 RepID=A0A7I7XS49_9MYCO|nr:class II glutamine amidotransferase [Mycolicibacterium confluentis]MCV7321437.1 class II glutamine amidotransferase [Mycolicibacterium confluentis]ORV33031.1 class II glutamine amidotransferase [Mycolicibacterium confluentis]BBZ32079.1 class II glutamine amidotransferase [Mycolicibacterium confluentis]